MNFLVLTPTRGTLFTATHEAVTREFRLNGQYPTWLVTNGLRLLDARNTLAKWAEEAKFPWDAALFLDDDVVLPEGAFAAFAKSLAKHDVAVMDYPHHWHPKLSDVPPTGIATYAQWLPGESTKGKVLAWAGLGSTAMTKSAFLKLKAKRDPLFRPSANAVEVSKLGVISLRATYDRGLSAQSEDYSAGEDTQFFFDCKAEGFSIEVLDQTAKHLRLDHAVSWAGAEKYAAVHVVEESTEITQPGNGLYKVTE
jgi:hypothetical protein